MTAKNIFNNNSEYCFRNVLMSNFTLPEMRQDKGAFWENFLISERVKHNAYQGRFVNTYFLRTHDQAEIDYLEESDGIIQAYEFKWKGKKFRFPASFLEAYPNNETAIISRDNFEDFVGL